MNIAFRVDAGPRIGTGHLMRCIALADALRRPGTVVRFVSRRPPEYMRELLDCRDYELAPIDGADGADAEETARALADLTWDWLVVDHYRLGAAWETMLRHHARRVLAIDDLADRAHDCDVLLDQNLQPDMARRYAGKVPPGCELLLGPRYALLRDEFRRARQEVAARTGPVSRVLVSFGGADPDNYTAVAIEALAGCGFHLAVDVVIGAGHPCRREIEAACGQHGFTCHVQTTRMAELLAAADLTIGAAGSTTWERCCLGVPSIVIATAPNQEAGAAEAARQGAHYLVGPGGVTADRLATHLRAVLDSGVLREMFSRNGMRLVDGRGAERVARVLERDAIRLRAATLDDAAAVFEWRNHERVRSGARNAAPIPWAEHDAWFRQALTDSHRLLLIGERDGIPIGVVRFDVRGCEAEVSLYRVPDSTEPGLASSLLLAAEAWFRARHPEVHRLTGCVLGHNERSHRLVQSAGWVLDAAYYSKRLREA